ncbi:hypothetical protein BDY24DRAFT_397083 [Mrakia frigida]|uniref:uncharacterized protein n=1 Tax=Mrakia frigida TaxID=29902 RepID=UPI003FCBEF5C
MNTPPPSPPGELVEDSEPEREQQRIAFKAQKREERKQKKLLLQQQQQQQQQQEGGMSRSSGTGEGFSAAGSSRVGGAAAASGGGDEEGSIQNGRNEGGRGGSSPFSSLSPTTTITTRPIDFSSYAYPKAKLKPSTSSNSFTSTTSTSAALPTTSSYFPARPSTSLPPPRRSKSKSIDPSDAPPECTFTDVEMRRLKKCVLCGEDWSQPGKKSRTKWAHLVNCTPAPSHSTLLDLIREYLDVVKAGGKEPRSLLEKKMFESVKEEDQAGQLWDAVPDEDVVLVVDESTLGKGKGKGRARGSRSVSATSKASSSSSSRRVVASVPPREEPRKSKSPSPFRSPSPTATADSSTSPPAPSIPVNNHFSNFAYAGRSLSASTSNGGIKPRSTSAAAVIKPVVPACTIRDVEMRKVKKCIFCEEDWSTGKKMIKSKWAHLYSCSLLQTPPVSLSLLTHQITTHLQAPEPKTLLESLTMKKPKAKRGKGASAIPSMVLPAGHELSRETVMRNVESLMGDAEDEDETRRDGDDEEMEERRPPPSTQSFGTSGLAARFGSRKGSASGQEKRSLWAVGEEDGEAAVAGPSRLGGHSSEEDDDDESGSDSSMNDETEEEQEEQPSKDAERPRTSLWGLAVDTTASQLVRAGDENILSSPPPPQTKSKPSLLVPTQTIISLSSSSSSSSAASSPLPTPLVQLSSSTADGFDGTSSNENSPSRPSPRSPFSARADPGRSSMEQENGEGSRRFDSEELEEERGGDSLISQEREERMSEDGPEVDEGGMVDEEVVGSREEEDVEEEATTNSSRSQQQRDISTISIEDNDEDNLSIQHQHQHQQQTPARNKLEPNDRDDLFSPSSNPSCSNTSKNSISINDRSHHIEHLNPNPKQSTSSPSSFPERNFWSDSPPRNASPSSSSYFLPPAQLTSTPNRSSNIGSSSRQEIIDLSDDDDDNWGQEGVLRWDGGEGNDLSPRDASSDDDVELLEHVSSSRPRPPTPTNAADPPSNVEEGDEPYDQSDDRWGEEGVLVWDDVAGDVDDDDEQAGRAVGGVAEEEIYEGLEEEEEEEVEEEPPSNKITPSKPKTKTVASNKPKKKKTKAPPVMPDYEMMSIPQLQKIMKSYGTKISSSRPQLLRVLKEYWWIEHPLPTSSASSNDDDDEQDRAPSPSPARPRPKALPPRSRFVDSDSDSEDDQPLRMTSKSKAKGKARLDSSEEEEFDSDAPLATPKKKSKSKSTSRKDTGEGVSIPMEELPELFRKMIVADEDLWLRILRYEPVDFMELVTLVNERKVKTKGWQTALKKWLDGQCITYWTEEQTGPRRRH